MIFTMFFELATALKIASDMSTNSINVSTAGVIDAKSIKAELAVLFRQLKMQVNYYDSLSTITFAQVTL